MLIGPVWDESASADDLRVLSENVGELDPTPDVVVVGGGTVGLAAAVMCRRAGIARVQVIERAARLANGPSGSAAGGLSPGVHALARTGPFVEMARKGLALHRELDREWDGALGLRSLDWMLASPAPVDPGGFAEGVEVLDDAGARSVEPELGEVAAAIVVRDQSWVHPLRLAAAYARRAGSVALGVTVTGMETAGGRVTRVNTSSGSVSPGVVVFATGTAPEGVPGLPASARSAVKGHLLVTEPAPFRLSAAVAGLVLVLQLEDGRLLAGGTFEPADAGPEVRGDTVRLITDELGRLLPAARGVEVARAWCCFRPSTHDELPLLDRVPGTDNAFVSVGHYRTGLLVAPAAGAALAAWITSGVAPEAGAALAAWITSGVAPEGLEALGADRPV